MKLLTRQEFKEQVFARSKGICAFCHREAVDAHHIIDRKCWKDGGYYLDNGIAVCEHCHWECEKSQITVEQCREAANIISVHLPDGWDVELTYDKWGNVL